MRTLDNAKEKERKRAEHKYTPVIGFFFWLSFVLISQQHEKFFTKGEQSKTKTEKHQNRST